MKYNKKAVADKCNTKNISNMSGAAARTGDLNKK